jgi:hypothetical protein
MTPDSPAKPAILILLQNAYSYKEWTMRIPVYTTKRINRKNATYSRIVPYLEPHFQLYFTECTPRIAPDSKTKYPTDLEWVKRGLEYQPWSAVLAFSNQAQQALTDLGHQDFIGLPHPVSFKWRKALIEETRDRLLAGLEVIESNIVNNS